MARTTPGRAGGGHVASRVGLILAQQEPYPCFCLACQPGRALRGVPDRGLVIRCRSAAGGESGGCIAGAGGTASADRELAGGGALIIRTVRSDAAADGSEATAAPLARLLGDPDVTPLGRSGLLEQWQDQVPTMSIRKADVTMRLFTTRAMLGTPLEATAEEVRIESFFPTDDATAALFRAWTNDTHGRPVLRRDLRPNCTDPNRDELLPPRRLLSYVYDSTTRARAGEPNILGGVEVLGCPG
jgi:hypothetical protein